MHKTQKLTDKKVGIKRPCEETSSIEEIWSKIQVIKVNTDVNTDEMKIGNNHPEEKKIYKLREKIVTTLYNVALSQKFSDNPNITRLAKTLTIMQDKYEELDKIINPKNNKSKLNVNLEISSSSSLSSSSLSPSSLSPSSLSPSSLSDAKSLATLKITPATQQQKEALLSTGEVIEEDINKYGIVGDYTDKYYKDWWVKKGDGYKKKEKKEGEEDMEEDKKKEGEEDMEEGEEDKKKYEKEDILYEVAKSEAEYYKFYNNTYTLGQLSKSYNKIAGSFILQNYGDKKCDGIEIVKYLQFIKDNPQFALPTLLWIDTFHDFKEERLNKGKRNLNEIIDYLCYRIYDNKHWGKLKEDSYVDNGITKTKFQTLTDCVVIGHHYNFDKMYQNSFFNFEEIKDTNTIKCGPPNINGECRVRVTGFHEDVIHTVLRPLVLDTDNKTFKDRPEVAKLLYDVSNVFINTTGGWEADFLYAYLMYNFNFDVNIEGLIQNLRDVFWNEIKADREEEYSIPYYAKDVDKGSGNFFKGTNVILPASLFDANRSNSSDVIEHFVPIEKTKIPLCNGYDFVYEYNPEYCNLTLKYTSKVNSEIQSFDLCGIPNNFISSNNSSCVSLDKKKRSNYTETIKSFIDNLLDNKKTQKQPLKAIDNSINQLLSLIETDNIYVPNNTDNDILEQIKNSVFSVYFDSNNNCVKIPNGQGMSPIDCVSVVIGLLIDVLGDNNSIYRNKYENGVLHPLSPISCKYLDFWVALKRIGDFGQIMQCKQLGIPLFTNDNMQLLISMAACSSAVWTGDNSKVLWYDATQDAILCNGLNPGIPRKECNKQRCNTEEYTKAIEPQLYFSGDTHNVITNNINMLEKTSKAIEGKEDLKPFINIRNGCVILKEDSSEVKMEIEETKKQIKNQNL